MIRNLPVLLFVKFILFFLLLFGITFPLNSEIIQRTVEVSEGETLDVDIRNGGSVDIHGWKKELISIKAFIKGRDAKSCQIEIEEAETGVEVISEFTGRKRRPKYELDLEIFVPEKFNLRIITSSGNVEISHVNGIIKGSTMSGDLLLKNLKGQIRMNTMGGEVLLSDSDLKGRVKTMGGNVSFRNVSGPVKGSSMGGDVVYDNSKPVNLSDDTVRISTLSGDINVEKAEAGADVHTMGGDIEIEQSKEFVVAKTLSGNIIIKDINGWVKSTTLNGNIEVNMTEKSSTLKDNRNDANLISKSGDINLTVPKDLSMEIDIELAYTRNCGKEYRVISDFDLKEEKTDEWDYSDGAPKKFVFCSGKTNGGKNKINIKTVNGNIYLKKR